MLREPIQPSSLLAHLDSEMSDIMKLRMSLKNLSQIKAHFFGLNLINVTRAAENPSTWTLTENGRSQLELLWQGPEGCPSP
jgi:hypothetical protein